MEWEIILKQKLWWQFSRAQSWNRFLMFYSSLSPIYGRLFTGHPVIHQVHSRQQCSAIIYLERPLKWLDQTLLFPQVCFYSRDSNGFSAMEKLSVASYVIRFAFFTDLTRHCMEQFICQLLGDIQRNEFGWALNVLNARNLLTFC